MRPETAGSSQLHLAGIHFSMENLASPLSRVTHILTGWVSVLLINEIHHENEHNDEEDTATMESCQNYGLGNNVSNVWDDNPSEPERMMQSKITSMWKMMEEQFEILNNAIQQNSQQCVQNAELMEANREYHWQSILLEATKT